MSHRNNERAAPHKRVQLKLRNPLHTAIYIYMTYCMNKSGKWRVISRVASCCHERKASANTAYE